MIKKKKKKKKKEASSITVESYVCEKDGEFFEFSLEFDVVKKREKNENVIPLQLIMVRPQFTP